MAACSAILNKNLCICSKVWIAEWGKFDMRKLVESGEENQKLFTKYVEKTVRVIMNSTHIPSNPSNEINFILDFDGLRIEQFASIPSKDFSSSISSHNVHGSGSLKLFEMVF